MECVVRGYFYGSLIGRWKNGSIELPENTDTTMAAKLTQPLFDPTTKSEHDIPVDKSKALEMNLVSEKQYNWLEKTSIDIYNQMASVANDAGFILADLKLEFGILDGKITLGDSIGKIQESYDKQILRDWLTANGYQKQFDDERNAGNEPTAPQIPTEIIQTITERYVIAYEKLTGQTL